MMPEEQIALKLQRLERRFRWLLLFNIVAVLGYCVGAATPLGNAVTAQKFILVDANGKQLATLGREEYRQFDNTRERVGLFLSDGRVALVSTENGGELSLADGRCVLAGSSTGDQLLQMYTSPRGPIARVRASSQTGQASVFLMGSLQTNIEAYSTNGLGGSWIHIHKPKKILVKKH